MGFPQSRIILLSIIYTVQVAEEPDLPVTSDIGPESAERAISHGDTISPSNVQVPSAAVAPSTSIIADNASTLASLRMVCATSGLQFSLFSLSPKNKNKYINNWKWLPSLGNACTDLLYLFPFNNSFLFA